MDFSPVGYEKPKWNHVADVPSIFGELVFNDRVMRERLPDEVYSSLKQTINQGRDLDIGVANVVAGVMKDWAIEKGATHYTHWFQPMTGITAEKHDSFVSCSGDGRVIMEFSGKELIKGEPDASSFPSGGLRATFEARGYTAWDPTSYAFIKGGSLCIPTVFCSYGGQVLDKKTPLIRSAEDLNFQALRILRLFGNKTVARVAATVGAEQEYFLIDKELFMQRKDLFFCGRTLFGAKPLKGQELEAHYFGALKPRIVAYMQELDKELWRLGILAKTRHNEAAPAQHELAPIFTSVNTATDHNQLTMEIMKNVALRHGLVCLLHEKPFAGINGSGKHNNWSLTTDTGRNLFNPGSLPHENARFLLFLCAVIKAVDEHQDLLRISVASAGNDLRLGGSEAPPSIVSIFLGDELTDILESIEKGETYAGIEHVDMEVGVSTLPTFPKDTTDRNRTSPFAFTGNKFEFRMLGSAISIACPNIMINTIVADALGEFADYLEDAQDFDIALNKLLKRTIRKHKRIIFNGDGYSKQWEQEAQKRGLLNLKTLPDALPYYIRRENLDLFYRHNIYTNIEMQSRYEIITDTYTKNILIEANTMLDMVGKDIIPAVSGYVSSLSKTVGAIKAIDENIPYKTELALIRKLAALEDSAYEKMMELEKIVLEMDSAGTVQSAAEYCRDSIIPAMNNLRKVVDAMEVHTSSDFWPFPTYSELMFRI